MKDYTKQFEKLEQKDWTTEPNKANKALAEWKRKYSKAKNYRTTCGWEKAAEDALKIRKNDLPLGDVQGIPKWKGKFYKDNWLWKSVKWQVSMLSGSAVELDVKSYGGLVTPAQDLLEQELNYAFDSFDFLAAIEDALYDSKYPGAGWVRGIWNTRKPTPNYATGTPTLEYVDCMNMTVDESTRKRNMSDCRYIFHEDYMDIYELNRRYPKYRDKIAETIENKNPEGSNRSKIITLQYKKVITLEKVYIEDRNTGIKSDFLLDEWLDFVADETKKPENKAIYEQYVLEQSAKDPALGEETLDYNQFVMEGGTLPEKVVMIGSIETDEDAVFQSIYLPDQDIVLEKPQYIGKTFSYFRLPGIHEPDSAYPYGLCHYMQDLLEISIILMTILTVQAVKTYKNEKLIAEDSLVNQETYQDRGYEIGINPIVKEEWQLRHPSERAVNPIPLAEFPQALSFLNDQVVNAQKTFSGATDAMMGLQSYSGDSGIKIAQLQAASRTYQREDIEAYRRFIMQCVEWLKAQIVMFRNYPHQIQGLDLEDRPGMVDVGTDITTKMSDDAYYVEVTIQDNQEVVKQIEREASAALFQQGLLSDVDYLRELDRPNPEKQAESAARYRGEKEALDILRQFPEAQQMLQQFAQQAQNPQTQPTQGA